MDFDLSEDQAALRDAARTLLEGLAPVERLRARVGTGTVVGTLPGAGAAGGLAGAVADGAPQGYDGELWAAMAEQGWTAVEVPAAEGGLGCGMVEVAVLCEELGRRVAPAPFVPTVLALGALRAATGGGGAAREGLAELSEAADRLASDDAVGCVAFAPGTDGGVRVSGAGPGGPVPGAPVRLTGRTAPVPYAPSADVAVVAAGDGLYAVRRRGDAPWSAPEPAMDRTRELGRLELVDAPALTLGGKGAQAALLDRAATAVSAELLGVADHALGLAVAYAKDRVQFGKPIGSFQAVKHRLADALVDVEGMRSTVYYAAWCTANGDPEASLAASMAKAWCSEASRRVLAASLQVHGGIGFTWEHELHCYLKRAQLDQVSFGDGPWHRDRIAGLLQARLDAGERIF